MRSILHLGIIALMAAVGSSFGQRFFPDNGTALGAFIGGVFGLLIIAALRAGARGP